MTHDYLNTFILPLTIAFLLGMILINRRRGR